MVIDLPLEVAQLSPKLVGRFLILLGQGNLKGAVSGRVVQVQPQMYVKIDCFIELHSAFKKTRIY